MEEKASTEAEQAAAAAFKKVGPNGEVLLGNMAHDVGICDKCAWQGSFAEFIAQLREGSAGTTNTCWP